MTIFFRRIRNQAKINTFWKNGVYFMDHEDYLDLIIAIKREGIQLVLNYTYKNEIYLDKDPSQKLIDNMKYLWIGTSKYLFSSIYKSEGANA